MKWKWQYSRFIESNPDEFINDYKLIQIDNNAAVNMINNHAWLL